MIAWIRGSTLKMTPLQSIIALLVFLSVAHGAPANITVSPSPKSTNITRNTTLLATLTNDLNETYILCSNEFLTGNYAADLADAVRGLDHFCPRHDVQPDNFYRSAWELTQIYYCDYHGTTPQPCSATEYWAADALINSRCGEDRGGWIVRNTPAHSWTIGRDPTLTDGEFRSECGMW